MIAGVGTDIVALPRMVRALARHGEAFADKILAAAELAEYHAAHDQARFLAKRFAAKEAFSKACGTGLRLPLCLTSLWVEHDALGRPAMAVSAEVAAWLTARLGNWTAHLSLSDEKETIIAFVVLEGARS